MTSRRPMTRSFSANGRTSSFSEDEGNGSNGRSEGRTSYLSNVRPENRRAAIIDIPLFASSPNSYSRYSHYRPARSTLCSIMAQLTEDIQPSFDTTLKSKAVSENCNVKFTCAVSGHPAPELKWYKDDMEMDRYCGLPKYEIRRNGKIHTLHIYNCTLEDAAIYQVSASNSKGIVSCSGVLEVGTMSEFKIHQRFFAKLKQKAEKKKKESEEQSKKADKENILKETVQNSPERPPRKRHIPSQDGPLVKEPDAGEQLGAAAEPNGVTLEVNDMAAVTSIDSGLEKEDALVKKKIKISNSVDVDISSDSSRSHMMGNGGENCYDGGISLAQFLAEALQSQAAEEKQNSSFGEKPKEMNVSDGKEKERMQKEWEEQGKALEEEYGKRREEDVAAEGENERKRSSEMLHTTGHGKHGSDVKHHKAHKDHDHHNIQASLSSMLHTVKDFFFGKNKKDSHDHTENKEKEFDHDSLQLLQPEMPLSFRLHQEPNPDVYKPSREDVVPMETDHPQEPSEHVDIVQQSHEHKCEDSFLHTDLPPDDKPPPERTEESTGQSVKVAVRATEAMDLSEATGSSRPSEDVSLSEPQVLTEMEHKDSQTASVNTEVPVNQREPECLIDSSEPNQQAARDESSPKGYMSASQQQTTAPHEEHPASAIAKFEEGWIPPNRVISLSDSHGFGRATQEEQLNIDLVGKVVKPDTAEGPSSSNKLCEEEKAEVKLLEQPCSDINRSEVTELPANSVDERVEPCENMTPDQVLPPLPAVTCAAEEDCVREENECTSPTQEMSLGFPAESLGLVDLKIQPKFHFPSAGEEVSQGQNLSAEQSASSGFSSSEKRSDLEEVSNFALENSLEGNLCYNVNTQEKVILESVNTEARDEHLQIEEMEKKVEEMDESKTLLVAETKGSEADVSEELTHQHGSEKQLGWPSVNIPTIHISTIEDSTDIQPTVPDVNQHEHFVIPKIEIMEPELKDSTVLELNKPESDLAMLQSHDATHMSETIIQDISVTDFPDSPSQKSMQSNNSLTEKVKEVAQLPDETKIIEQGQPHKQSSEQLPQMETALIPVINVSCTDDKQDHAFVNANVSHVLEPFETPTVPLFVVPPISVTCHESDPGLGLPTQSEWTETETDVTLRVTNHNAVNDLMTKPEKSLSGQQTVEEVAGKIIKENTPSLLSEALTPKAGDNVPSSNKTTEDNTVPEISKIKPLKEPKTENSVSEEVQRSRPSVDRLSSKPPAHPSLSPASLRKFMSKAVLDSDSETVTAVPVITVGDRQSDKADEDLSGGSTPTSSLSCENSPRLKRRDSLSLIRSATPEELASGARRKIFILKPKEDGDGAVVGALDTQGKKETPYMSPSQARRAALLQAPKGQNTPPMERRSPLLNRRKATLEVPKAMDETPKEEAVTKKEEKPAEKKLDPLKAPQVIRKIRGEPFPDASGHLKLWCQFFNVLSDSTIKWYREEEEILEVKRSGGDESQVALAIVLASSQDCGVYGCTINNEYGTDTTDFLLSVDVLSDILLKDDLEVGEEIEMTPLLFTKGLVDCGSWGDKYFGRIMNEAVHIGEGCAHKASRVRVIYGLDPIFDSGSNCIIKILNPIAYGTKQESNLAERNLEITKQECKVQNMIREYCKIFTAEARVNENFGFSLEVIPQYLMYRPANSVPYATVEANLEGVFQKYCMMGPKGQLITQTVSEVEQKCSSFQHWIHQWTHGNLLVTRLEGVETKLTNVRVVTKSKGYQGLTERGSPEVFDQFLTQHQCNYYCGLLCLRSLKNMDSLQQPTKIKGSRSPLLNRKLGSGSPQLQRKGHSPQISRKANSSPKVTRKVQETEDNKSDTKTKPAETADALEMQ